MTLHDCIKPPKETNSVEVDLSPTSDSDDSVVLRRNDYSFDNVIGFLEDMLIGETVTFDFFFCNCKIIS